MLLNARNFKNTNNPVKKRGVECVRRHLLRFLQELGYGAYVVNILNTLTYC